MFVIGCPGGKVVKSGGGRLGKALNEAVKLTSHCPVQAAGVEQAPAISDCCANGWPHQWEPRLLGLARGGKRPCGMVITGKVTA